MTKLSYCIQLLSKILMLLNKSLNRLNSVEVTRVMTSLRRLFILVVKTKKYSFEDSNFRRDIIIFVYEQKKYN